MLQDELKAIGIDLYAGKQRTRVRIKEIWVCF
jgi:hypothetical protein